jgi:hypothetical protein
MSLPEKSYTKQNAYLGSQFQNVPFWPIFSLRSKSFAMTSGVGLKFQSSIPMESGLTVEIFARLFNPVSLRGTLTKLKRFEIGSGYFLFLLMFSCLLYSHNRLIISTV